MSTDNIPAGQSARPQIQEGEYSRVAFIVQQALGKVQTATLVKVVGVTNAGGVSPVGLVDVLPLVNQLDSSGTPTPHTTIFNLPYLRMQGGADAIILDPKVGDIGVAVFASRDITKVKASKKQANPGSFRQFSFADGMYLGGMLNGTPTQYVRFEAGGITVHSPTKVTIDAPTVEVTAQNATITASVAATITAPLIKLGATGQSLLAFVTSAFQSLFNTHTHPTPAGQSSAPSQSLGSTHLTSTVQGG